MDSPIASKKYKTWFLLSVCLFSMIIMKSCSSSRHSRNHSHYSYSPPPWAPAYGYRASTRFVYFPEIGVYYDLYHNQYIYPQGGSWMVVHTLPPAYSSYDLRRLRQQQLTQRRDPQRYQPRNRNTIRDNSEYTPRRGGTPATRNPQNPPPTNQRTPPPANPPHQNTPRGGGGDPPPGSQTPPQQRSQETRPAPRQNTPRRGGNPPATNEQPVRRNQTPERARVTPPEQKAPPSNQPAPTRRQSRRGGGGGV